MALPGGCGTPGRRPLSTVAAVTAAPEERVPFAPDLRAEEVRLLCAAMRDSYAHLQTKQTQWGLNLDQLCPQYEAAIRRADTWARYERVMVALVSEFHDGHVAWRRQRGGTEPRRRRVRLGLDSVFVADALVVSDVWPGSGAVRAGLAVGDVITAIDGHMVDERLGGLAELRSWSRREAARYDFAEEWPSQRIEAESPPPARRLTIQRDDGRYETVSVDPETAPRPDRERRPAVLQRQADTAVLKVRTLGAPLADLEKRLDEIAAELGGGDATATPATIPLIVDLRGNPGGLDRAAPAVAARRVDRPGAGGGVRGRPAPRARAAHAEWKSLAEDASRPGWSVPQPVVAGPGPRRLPARATVGLIDAGCRSSCETLALLLRAAGLRLVGERTGGSSGAPVTMTLPHSGARVTIPARATFDATGAPIEGLGVAPDEIVTATRADIIAHRDPALERAAALATAR